MIIADCYETANDYILKEAVKYSEMSRKKFCVCGNYIMSDKELDWKNFRYKWQYQSKQRVVYDKRPYPEMDTNYGFKRIGEVKIDKWQDKPIHNEVQYIPILQYHCLKLEKRKNGILMLHIDKKKYKMKNSIHMVRYFYRQLDKEYFEKDYNILTENIEHMEDKYYKYNMTDKYYGSKRRNNYMIVKPFFDDISEEFNFELFYEEYFKRLTICQQRVFALMLLGIRITDISRMLDTSEPYIFLERGRIIKKINKMYKKIKVCPYIRIENDEEYIEDNMDKAVVEVK
jgi:hypothetical protein